MTIRTGTAAYVTAHRERVDRDRGRVPGAVIAGIPGADRRGHQRQTAHGERDRGGSGDAIVHLRRQVEGALAELLAEELSGVTPAIAEPVRYAVLGSGKRLRPLLGLAAYRACGGADPIFARLACSVELVHAYSLVHDDLPCMDDDVLRRGRPTLHVRFCPRTAVLAGAILMPMAVRTIWHGGASLGLNEPDRRRLVARLTAAAGGGGMVGGQLLDLRAEGRDIAPDALERIHAGKTAALMAAATVLGGVAAGAPEALVDRLDRFGTRLGLAFQAVDDILDVTGTDRELGKESGRDRALDKATFPAVFGLEEAERRGRHLARAALAELEGWEAATELRHIAEYATTRRM